MSIQDFKYGDKFPCCLFICIGCPITRQAAYIDASAKAGALRKAMEQKARPEDTLKQYRSGNFPNGVSVTDANGRDAKGVCGAKADALLHTTGEREDAGRWWRSKIGYCTSAVPDHQHRRGR